MASEAIRWWLFVDESGNFADSNDDIVTVGLLLRGDVKGSSPAQLRSTLRAAVPDVPWPIHANRLNRPVLLALASYVARNPLLPVDATVARDGRLRNFAKRVLSCLMRLNRSDLSIVVGQLVLGETPEVDVLERLDRCLQEADPALYSEARRRYREKGDSKASVLWTRLRLAAGSHPIHLLDSPLLLAFEEYAAACAARIAGPQPWITPNPVVVSVTDRTLALLKAKRPQALVAVIGAIALGLEADWALLRDLDLELKRSSEGRRLRFYLFQRCRNIQTAICDTVKNLSTTGEENGKTVAMMISCGETERGDASPSVNPASDEGSERYLALLRGLLERTVDVLDLRDGAHDVRVQVLSRPLIDPLIRERVQLHIRHLGELIVKLESPARSKVRLIQERVSYFEDDVDPALVLADFVANRVRPELRKATDPLATVEDAISDAVGAEARSGQPPLSNLAATGGADEVIRAARRGSVITSGSAASAYPQWAWEQAEKWAAYFRTRP
jgi:hypothetical protein